MVYFCADDYGISEESNRRIEECLDCGAFKKISVLPNGEIENFTERLSGSDIALHLNLVEGRPLSKPEEIRLLVNKKGFFKYSFLGLFALSLSRKRKLFEKHLYKEIQSQIKFWEKTMGECGKCILIDSHQHTHMIPLVFKTLVRVIEDEKVNVDSLRIPAEPLLPYIFTPSLYRDYSLKGFVKQWILKGLAVINRKEFKKLKIDSAYFMGVMLSGKLEEKKIKKLLPHYLKIAEKRGKDIEIGFHPGYLKEGEKLAEGLRKDFEKFYFSSWREVEYNTVKNFKFE